jgi:hypothetical protein
MTRALPFTQAGIRRAIEAAHKSGYRVVGIRPDGTLILEKQDQGNPQLAESLDDDGKVVL